MPEAMRVLEGMFRRQGMGDVRNQPRVRIALPEGRGVMHTLPAYVPGQPGDATVAGPGFVGLKTYTVAGGKARFVVLLSSAEDGRLLAINVIMRPTRSSEQAVPATKGTRHTSAARHTYDCPDVIAFVVSTDGPVTVFSDGRRIADLKSQEVRKTAETIAALAAERRAERGWT